MLLPRRIVVYYYKKNCRKLHEVNETDILFEPIRAEINRKYRKRSVYRENDWE